MAEELVGGCISKKIWDQMCANTLDLENATLEKIEAGLDPPEGWLDPPSLSKKKLTRRRLSVQVSYPHRKLVDLLLQFPRRKSMKLQKEWCQRTQKRTTLGQREHLMLGCRSETS